MVYVCMVLLVECYVQIIAETDLVFKFMVFFNGIVLILLFL